MAEKQHRLATIVRKACAMRDAGRYRHARSMFRWALLVAETSFGVRSAEAAGVLNHFGMLLKYSGRFDDAVVVYRRSLRIARPFRNDLTADLYHNLAGAEYGRGNFAKGEIYANLGLRLRLKVEGGCGLGVAGDIAALAALVEGLGRTAEAEEMYRKALPVVEVFCDWPTVTVVLNNLGALCQQDGRLGEAESLYRRAILLKRTLLGRSHPDLAVTLNNLATLYKRMGRIGRASALYRRALVILEGKLDASHPHLLGCRANLAGLAA